MSKGRLAACFSVESTEPFSITVFVLHWAAFAYTQGSVIKTNLHIGDLRRREMFVWRAYDFVERGVG